MSYKNSGKRPEIILTGIPDNAHIEIAVVADTLNQSADIIVQSARITFQELNFIKYFCIYPCDKIILIPEVIVKCPLADCTVFTYHVDGDFVDRIFTETLY